MNNYIKNIQVRQVFHLKNFRIDLAEDACHLMLTGRNGSGKTILLKAIKRFLDLVKSGANIGAEVRRSTSHPGKLDCGLSDEIEEEVFLELNPSTANPAQYEDFIVIVFDALRKISWKEPQKDLASLMYGAETDSWGVSTADSFLLFLANLKIQEVLARAENQLEDAEKIQGWFQTFEKLLQEIFEDSELKLVFNYKTYAFRILSQGKEFAFSEMSDGFMAAMDIVATLILRMQKTDSLTRVYEQPGIVLIDEVETHLHLSLQKNIMKILTRLFPKIQFIVTTHSPFVLNSLENATAFDLERQEPITDLTEYSYEALAEGYFGVKTESSYVGQRLEQLRRYLKQEKLTAAEKLKAKALVEEFHKIPEPISPVYVGAFYQLMIEAGDRLQ